MQVFKFLVFPQLNFLSNKLCRAKSPWKVKRSARGHLRSLMSMKNEQKAQKCVCVKTGPNKLRRKLLNWLHHMSATVQIVAKPHRLNSRWAAYFANKVITECKFIYKTFISECTNLKKKKSKIKRNSANLVKQTAFSPICTQSTWQIKWGGKMNKMLLSIKWTTQRLHCITGL